MSNKLKNFIEENRRAFDSEMPSASAWSRIEDEITRREKQPRHMFGGLLKWSAAAAVFFIMVTGIYFFASRKNEPAPGPVAIKEQPVELGTIPPEYAARAKRIYAAIGERQKQLREMSSVQPQLYDQFAQDLAALDSAYRVLRAQAAKNANREILLRAMMQNLQLQAELLAKQLQVIDDFNNKKTDNHEKDDYRPL